MKSSDKAKPGNTLPDGIWEGSSPKQDKDKNKCTLTTDLQGNGYPVKQSK